MASRCRSISRPAFAFIAKATAKPSPLPPAASPFRSPLASVVSSRRSAGALQSLLPLHSAVSAARLTSRLGVDSCSASKSLYQGMACCSNPGV